MSVKNSGEQHIAVFGESGSGKTVLLSSFFGATQEPQFSRKSLFHVLPGDIGQGNRLQKNYLGMKNEAKLPPATKFAATSYAFTIKQKVEATEKVQKGRAFENLKIVWHDYPGEWFEQSVEGEEAQRKIDTFRQLLGSDVAMMLVDGQKLLDHQGEEERYLKNLFSNFRNGLLTIKDELLQDGQPLVVFPRIWILALSKADLLPDMGVYDFRDLLIQKTAEDIGELREVISGLITGTDALSFGEDFVLFSSAKFEPNKIEVTERIGLDLIMPIAAVLPLERFARWAKSQTIPAEVLNQLLSGVTALALVLGSVDKLPAPVKAIVRKLDKYQLQRMIKLVSAAALLAQGPLNDAAAQGRAKHDTLRATLADFRLALQTGEAKDVLIRSPR